ncbi:hypothetical protein ACI2LJ_08490 [Streptomyces sp. NPDC088090]|uniref:hypothetical protein n=1 Tax=Streptomyces sp. NPDC088090 TaxID=3365822 RepID=UPI00384E534B
MAHDSLTRPGTTLPDAAPADTCTVLVSLRDTPGALARIAATLGGTPVLALAYVVTGSARARAEIRLPRAHATRARNKLNRMVDTLSVGEPVPAPARPL